MPRTVRMPTGTVTFFFTDIEGSTRLWEAHPRAMRAAVTRHDLLLREAIERHGGYVFKTVGDAFCAAFPTAPDALEAALDAERALRDADWSALGVEPVKARIALHTGVGEVRDNDYFGLPLNRVARLLSTGHGGQILLSLATQQLVRDHLPEGAALKDLGEGGLKDLVRAEHVYQVIAPDLPQEFPPLKSLDTRYVEPEATGEGVLVQVPTHNPYKGLRAFMESDAADFFGREALTERLLGRMSEKGDFTRFLAVVGPSGSGKSSVVRAGLVPALKAGKLPGSERWSVVEILPGTHPMEELEAVLLGLATGPNPPETLIGQMNEDERGLVRAIKRVLPRDDSVELVIVIDQFEELFTLVESEAARVHFLACLYAAITDPRSRLRVIITLRADFFDRPLVYPNSGELMRQRTAVVLPLLPEELEWAIVRPAQRVGVSLEAELLTTIVQDVSEQPGALPLLQYALTELFEQRIGRTMTLEVYQTSAGVLGALARRADEIYAELTSQEQETARHLFLRLVTLGEGAEDTRRRVRMSELTSAMGTRFDAEGSQALERVLDEFGRYRLLTFDRDPVTRGPTVEVAHEALIRTWGKLHEWLGASRADLQVQRQLMAAASEWTQAGRDRSFLANGARLTQFEVLAQGVDRPGGVALTGEEQEYLAASAEERDRQEKAETERQARELALQKRAASGLRWLVATLSVFLVVAIGLSLLAVDRGSAAERERKAAQEQVRVNRAEALAAQALGQERDPELGILLASEAITTTLRVGEPVRPQAITALHVALARSQLRQTLRGHKASVNYASYSPNGSYIVSASGDNTAKIWEASTGQIQQTLTGHNNEVWSADYSPDGKSIVTASSDHTAKVWDGVTGEERLTLEGHSSDVNSATYSPDGRNIVTASSDKTAKIWDAFTGRLLTTLVGHSDWVSSAAYSPDGLRVVTAGGGDNVAKVWDAITGHELLNLKGHTGGVINAAYSPDGKSIVTASADGRAIVWDAATGQERVTLKGHAGTVLRAAYSPDGRNIVTTSDDKSARIWDAFTGQEQTTLWGHSNVVFTGAYSPDGKNIVTASLDGTVKVWDAVLNQERPVLIGHNDQVRSAAYSPDGKNIVTASADNTAKIWDAVSGYEHMAFQGHTDIVNSAAYSPDGKNIVTASADNTAKIWDAVSGRDLMTLRGHTKAVFAVAYSPNGRYIATAGLDGTAKVWDPSTGEEIRTLHSGANRVWGVDWSPDSKYLVTANDDNTAIVWDAESGERRATLTGHTDRVVAVAWSPDGRFISTASNDKTARVWNADTGRLHLILLGHTALVNSVAYSIDGKSIVTASDDATAKIWNAASGQELATLMGHSAGVIRAVYSPDGRFILTAGADKTARQYLTQLPDLIELSAARVTRDLTPEERATYLGEALPTPTVVPVNPAPVTTTP